MPEAIAWLLLEPGLKFPLEMPPCTEFLHYEAEYSTDYSNSRDRSR